MSFNVDTFTANMNDGIAWLDRHFQSRSWLKRIDLDSFRLSSFSNCVLGQAFGQFRNGAYILMEMNYSPDELGFYLPFATREEYEYASHIWRLRLAELKAQAA